MVTLTTIGFGDVCPKTNLEKVRVPPRCRPNQSGVSLTWRCVFRGRLLRCS